MRVLKGILAADVAADAAIGLCQIVTSAMYSSGNVTVAPWKK